jgi:hypothetical protein
MIGRVDVWINVWRKIMEINIVMETMRNYRVLLLVNSSKEDYLNESFLEVIQGDAYRLKQRAILE